MCLAIPGRVVELAPSELEPGKVEFGGIVKEVSLAYVPEVKVGDYVVVHAGFAISIVDAAAAEASLQYLRQLADELGELKEDGKP